ncbi:hypothetical protein LEMLEM_LOCUS19128 [Lemmus lemmus]
MWSPFNSVTRGPTIPSETAWLGRCPPHPQAMACSRRSFCPSEPLRLEPPDIALALLSTAMVKNWTLQAHNLQVHFRGPVPFVPGLAGLNNG